MTKLGKVDEALVFLQEWISEETDCEELQEVFNVISDCIDHLREDVLLLRERRDD